MKRVEYVHLTKGCGRLVAKVLALHDDYLKGVVGNGSASYSTYPNINYSLLSGDDMLRCSDIPFVLERLKECARVINARCSYASIGTPLNGLIAELEIFQKELEQS